MAALTLIDDGSETVIDATIAGDAVRLAPPAMTRALGWKLEPAGLCRDGVCVPVRDRSALVRDGAIDLAALAGLLERPLALDATEHAAWLGVGAAARGAALASLAAPDFTLPDLAGHPVSLHDFRGRKVFLLAWASW